MAGTPLSAASAVALVARRELVTRLRSRAFLITTGLMVLAVVGMSAAVRLIGVDNPSEVGFARPVAALAAPFEAAAGAVGADVTTSVVDQADGERRVRDGDLDALLVGTAEAPRVIVEDDLDESLEQALTVLAQRQVLDREIAAAGGDPAAVNAAVAAARVPVDSIEPAQEFRGERIAIGVLAGILVYLALLVFGGAVAQGVVEEKANRIVELLLTTIRPWHLMLGKVLGIGVVGLLQLALTVGAGLGAGLALGALSLPGSVATGAGLWALAWFLLGYLMYALLLAAAGALVSRQEDAGGVTAPVIMMIVIPYVLAISVLPADPGNSLIRSLSLVPFFAPLIMPMRIAMGAVAGWEIAAAVAGTLLVTVVLVWLAGRVYGNAVLRVGSKVSLRDALRA